MDLRAGGFKVILFKAITSDGDKYSNVLEKNEVCHCTVPVIQFEFQNLDKLWNCLRRHQLYSGLVLSSPRVVESIKQAINQCPAKKNEWDEELRSIWNSKPNYVVGQSSAKEAADIGLHNTLGQHTGSADKLADDIIKANRNSTTLLMPTGNLSSEKFSKKLQLSGIYTQQVIVYNTIEHCDLKSNISSHLIIDDAANNISLQILVFFSPSGFRYFLTHFKSLHLNINKLKIIAIGPTTECEISKQGFTCDATAASPTPEDVFSCVREVAGVLP